MSHEEGRFEKSPHGFLLMFSVFRIIKNWISIDFCFHIPKPLLALSWKAIACLSALSSRRDAAPGNTSGGFFDPKPSLDLKKEANYNLQQAQAEEKPCLDLLKKPPKNKKYYPKGTLVRPKIKNHLKQNQAWINGTSNTMTETSVKSRETVRHPPQKTAKNQLIRPINDRTHPCTHTPTVQLLITTCRHALPNQHSTCITMHETSKRAQQATFDIQKHLGILWANHWYGHGFSSPKLTILVLTNPFWQTLHRTSIQTTAAGADQHHLLWERLLSKPLTLCCSWRQSWCHWLAFKAITSLLCGSFRAPERRLRDQTVRLRKPQESCCMLLQCPIAFPGFLEVPPVVGSAGWCWDGLKAPNF